MRFPSLIPSLSTRPQPRPLLQPLLQQDSTPPDDSYFDVDRADEATAPAPVPEFAPFAAQSAGAFEPEDSYFDVDQAENASSKSSVTPTTPAKKDDEEMGFGFGDLAGTLVRPFNASDVLQNIWVSKKAARRRVRRTRCLVGVVIAI